MTVTYNQDKDAVEVCNHGDEITLSYERAMMIDYSPLGPAIQNALAHPNQSIVVPTRFVPHPPLDV